MLRAENQPHAPFARHSPQRALLTGWSLLIACSPLHLVREREKEKKTSWLMDMCMDMWLILSLVHSVLGEPYGSNIVVLC